MIAGTCKGKVIVRREMKGKAAETLAAMIVLEVKNYAMGQVNTVLVECFLPKYLEGKKTFFMNPENTYMIVSFDHFTTPTDDVYDGKMAHLSVVVVNCYRS